MGATPHQTGRSATLNNQGSVSGSLGVLAGGALETATINNSGTITGQETAIFANLSGDLVVNNEEGGEITSNGSVAINPADGPLTIDNSGTHHRANNNAQKDDNQG